MCEVLRHGLSGDGHAVAVHEAGVEQRLHDHGDTADGVDVGHDVLAEGLDVGEVWNLRSDAGEVGEGQFDLSFVRDGQQVQHGVG